MPVTPKQLEHMRQLEREHRDKQDAFIRQWRKEQQMMNEPVKPDADDTLQTTNMGADLDERE